MEREKQARDEHRKLMRNRPYWVRVVAANGGTEPSHEELLRTMPERMATQKQLCPRCHGSGYLHYDVPFDHPQFAKRVPCRCRESELETKRRERSQRLADLTTEMSEMTLATYNQACDPEAYAATMAFITGANAAGQVAPPWLYFEGNPGGGKTHLMAAIAHAYLERGERVMFRVVPKLLDWFRAGFKQNPSDDDDFQWRFDEVCNVPLLLLDDLGSEHNTPWSRERLFTLINHRYARNLRTVFSTNVGLSDADERIRSRIMDQAKCELVFTTDEDYRSRADRKQQRAKKGA